MNKTTEIVIYKTKSGNIEFRADIEKETLWATQAQLAQVFGVNSQAVTKHLKNIYKEKELSKKATCSKVEQVQKAGMLDLTRFTPEALTAITLLIAESRPSDKDNMIGLILMLLGK